MTNTIESDVSLLLGKCSSGHEESSQRLLALLYSELHTLAVRCMRDQPSEHTLQATALLHEAYLRLLELSGQHWKDRAHFLKVAARAMRSVLVDHARSKQCAKRSLERVQDALDQIMRSHQERVDNLVALHEAVDRLARFDEAMAQAVDLRFFAGLDVNETAEVLGMPRRTFDRHWAATRAWLRVEMQ